MSVTMECGTVLAERVAVAESFSSRLKGWMFRGVPSSNEALLLPRCASVHTLFMRFPIDVVFLDGNNRVLSVREGLAPWRAAACSGAASTLELASGRIRAAGLCAGRLLRVEGEAV